MHYCCGMMENALPISNSILKCYERHKLNRKILLYSLLVGRVNTNEKLPNDFLSECFDNGIKNYPACIIEHLLPIYCPIDKQIKQFNIAPHPDEWSYDRFTPALKRFMGNKVDISIIKEFLSKYLYKKDNPPGVDKFIHRLAELCFAT